MASQTEPHKRNKVVARRKKTLVQTKDCRVYLLRDNDRAYGDVVLRHPYHEDDGGFLPSRHQGRRFDSQTLNQTGHSDGAPCAKTLENYGKDRVPHFCVML